MAKEVRRTVPVILDARDAAEVKAAVAELFRTSANNVGVEVNLPVNSRVGVVTIEVAVST